MSWYHTRRSLGYALLATVWRGEHSWYLTCYVRTVNNIHGILNTRRSLGDTPPGTTLDTPKIKLWGGGGLSID
eukprot:11738160-Alexandrium_andersonii.AAC.1